MKKAVEGSPERATKVQLRVVDPTTPELEEHFKIKRDEFREKRDLEKQKASETARAAKALKIDPKGIINNPIEKRRVMSASFNAITRRKRDLLADGTGLVRDKVPDPGHY